ncbi:secretory immunoglobulin A-binding protein EsiB-like [Sciurus carolinensis]|uniref:secretory immunoglobulin A-binding protein EsiB-like n=1 Tax=Sciurus carolinensis TaxID=30640 RepID=UPI001FB3C20F|nr:secretory immunoglobulin A-binding protein EsiB-like [Sciurus carolinensis]
MRGLGQKQQTKVLCRDGRRSQLRKDKMKFLILGKQEGRTPASHTHTPGASQPRQRRTRSLDAWTKGELLVTVGTMISLLYIWLYSQSFHFHVAHFYAHLGYPRAQLIVGQRYLKGAGVVKDEERAMHWFRQASQQDHTHAAFNLAVRKLKNSRTEVGIPSLIPTGGCGNIHHGHHGNQWAVFDSYFYM